MNLQTINMLQCPQCSSGILKHQSFCEDEQGELIEGVIWCEACQVWFPIEDGLLEFLTPKLAYSVERMLFLERHHERISTLGLKIPNKMNDADTNTPQSKQQQHFDWYANNLQGQTYLDYEKMPFWTAVDKFIFDDWNTEIRSRAGCSRYMLEVGCAQGRSNFKIADHENLQIIAFDISKQMVRQAIEREKQARQGKKKQREFFVADASQFPLKAGCFDYVLIYGVLHHLPNPAVICQEIARVLKPSGVFLGSENNKSAFRIIFDWLQNLFPLWHEEAGEEALIAAQSLQDWFQGTRMQIRTTTGVFLPPHFFNLFTAENAYRILKVTDYIFVKIPLMRNNGGLIHIHGVKANTYY